jgi:hypothetical protein
MRGEFINEYQKLNSEDQKTFRRWLWANTVVGAILLTGLIALASVKSESCWIFLSGRHPLTAGY